MPRIVALVVAAVVLVGAAGCGSGGGDDSTDRAVATTPGGSVDGDSTTTVPAPLYDTPFCEAARGLDALGREPAPADRSAQEVLAQTERLAGFIEVLAATRPGDAPAAVDALVEDYRILSAAIVDAEGDIEAAFAVLDAEDPELSVRLGLPDSYHEAVVFFADRCGTSIPGAEP